MTTPMNIEIDEGLRDDAIAVLAGLGLTVADAVNLLLKRVAEEKALPFDTFRPNAETVAAMEEARRGGLVSHATVASQMADLDAED